MGETSADSTCSMLNDVRQHIAILIGVCRRDEKLESWLESEEGRSLIPLLQQHGGGGSAVSGGGDAVPGTVLEAFEMFL
jgi:hypothetical protein